MSDYNQYKFLLCDRLQPGILKITLNRPEQLNAISPELHTELSQIWRDVAHDSETRCVLFTGAGRAFSAGGDLGNMQKVWRNRDVATTALEARQIVNGMLDTPQPIIAMVNGHAVGLGATLALACDLVIATEQARIGDPHVNVGLVAGDGGTLFWPLAIGPHRAKQYLLTGELMSGAAAAAIGLINRAVSPEELEPTALALAQQLVALPPLAVQWTKLSINKILKLIGNTSFETAIAYESATMSSDDHLEAVTAFIEKRSPNFVGR